MLGLVVRHPSLGGHLVQVVAQSVELLLALGLGSVDGLVLAGLIGESLVGVGQLLLNHPPVPIGLLQQGAGLLQGVLVGVAPPVGRDEVVLGNGLGAGFLLVLGLHLPQPLLDHLDLTLALSIGSISVLQGGVEIQNISLQLLLHAESLNLALGLGLQSHLHALKSLAKVLLGGGKLLLLLRDALLN